MKVQREELEKELDSIFLQLNKNRNASILYDKVYEMYQVPKTLTSDLVCNRIPMSNVSEFILFTIISALKELEIVTEVRVKKFFVDAEIKEYSKSKYETDIKKFPIHLSNMVQITSDQWIGRITLKELISFRDWQLINYNENTQRTMKKTMQGGVETYKIAINKNSIKEMYSLFKANHFVPNTITLNIPEDNANDFVYNQESMSLQINSLKHFDIVDGYHRYLTLCRLAAEDSSFDYTMELRVTNFPESRCKQFIFQEDQKTKMKKLDSSAMNQTKPANIVCERLNSDPIFYLQGCVSRNEGLVPLGELAEVIDYYYFKGVDSKANPKLAIIETTKEIRTAWNLLIDYDPKYLTHKYTFMELAVLIHIIRTQKANDIGIIVEKVYQLLDKLNSKKFAAKAMKKTIVNDINKLLEAL